MKNPKNKILYTDVDGIARFVDLPISFKPVNERTSLSETFLSSGFQFRYSPQGIFNDWHCTLKSSTQIVVVTSGLMRVGLRDGTSVDFHPGDQFLSMDIQPTPTLESHQGHTSAAVGESPLTTLFVKVPYEEAEKLLASALG